MSNPLPPNPNDKVDKGSELGTLIVVLLKARNLNDKHSFRKSDVFAQAILNGAQKRTSVDIKGGQHPEWDGEVRFPVMRSTSEKHRKLEVACYSQEPRSEDLMGKGVVDITQTLQTGEFDDWVPLEIDGVRRGEIYLEMTYYANAPPPVHTAASNKLLSVVQNQSNGLVRRPSKLLPAERLSRPPPGRLLDQSSSHAYGHSAPSVNSRPPSRSNDQHHLQQHVSNIGPDVVPASLTPTRPVESSPTGKPGVSSANVSYSSSTVPLRGQAVQQQGQAALPTILRPGPPYGSPPSTPSVPKPIPRPSQDEFDHTRNPSSLAPSNRLYVSPTNPYINLPQGSSPNPYIGGAASSPKLSPPNPYIGSVSRPMSSFIGSVPVQGPYAGFSSSPDGQSLTWRQESVPLPPSQGQFTFPGALLPPNHQQSSSWYNQQTALPTASSTDRDPYLQARYQTPLPLPLEASSTSKITWSPPAKATNPLPNNAHLEALKRAEDGAKRRRAQELKDLELAMELDRQLNMDTSASSSAAPAVATNGISSRMPGVW